MEMRLSHRLLLLLCDWLCSLMFTGMQQQIMMHNRLNPSDHHESYCDACTGFSCAQALRKKTRPSRISFYLHSLFKPRFYSWYLTICWTMRSMSQRITTTAEEWRAYKQFNVVLCHHHTHISWRCSHILRRYKSGMATLWKCQVEPCKLSGPT